MLELALKGSKRYYGWIAFLLVVIGIGSTALIDQWMNGLKITGMSRDVSWGFYISQFTYLVGLAASGVMIVLPNYFHSYKTNKHMVIFGEFMAIAACIMCLLFIVVDIGQPTRMMNMIFHPTPNSILFWDMIVLNGYLFLNLLVGWTCLQADRQHLPHPKWLKPFIYTSIIWAFSIHTVTAFLYQGLPGRHYWLTAILAARFLASAFCSGPAILLLVMMLTEKFTTFKMAKNAVKTLVKIIAYAMCVNMFFFALEIFTSFYSNIPGHMHPIVVPVLACHPGPGHPDVGLHRLCRDRHHPAGDPALPQQLQAAALDPWHPDHRDLDRQGPRTAHRRFQSHAVRDRDHLLAHAQGADGLHDGLRDRRAGRDRALQDRHRSQGRGRAFPDPALRLFHRGHLRVRS